MSFDGDLESELIPRNIDSWNIGMRRVNRIVQEEHAAGFYAFATGMYSNGVDILVYDENYKLIKVYESANYAMNNYIDLKKATRYRNNLIQFPEQQKILVVSSDRNVDSLPGGKSFFTQHGIEVRVEGYQD